MLVEESATHRTSTRLPLANRRQLVLLFGAAVYLIAAAVTFYFVGKRTHFAQFYLLDDTYIHLALAKNLVRTGTFGVSPHVFSAVASSVLWPFVVAGLFAISGVSALTPLGMELVLSLALLYAANRLFTRTVPGAPMWLGVGLQLSLIFSASLLVLTFGGMEHILQTLADLLFLYMAGRRLAGHHASAATLYGLATLATATRYEGLFLVLAACVLLLWRRDWICSFTCGLCSLLPVLGMGLFSMAHGSHFLPNSLLLKAAGRSQMHFRPAIFGPPSQGILCRYAWEQGVAETFLACCALLLLGQLVPTLLSRRVRFMLAIYVGTALLHSQFSRLGWIYRYEGYLLALGAFLIFCGAAELWEARGEIRFVWVGLAVCALGFIGMLPRSVLVTSRIPHHAEAIYQQQYQMGQFLARYYPGMPVAANDIGAIAFFGDHEILDLAGLASVQVTNLVMEHRLTTDAIRQLAREHKTVIAVAYPTWFTGTSELPPDWKVVQSWDYNASFLNAVGGIHVWFYAVQPDAAAGLASNLIEFTPNLPKGVTVGIPLR